jgi:hypothetical protein
MSNDKTLLDQIDDLVASKTFNLDALEGIKQIKDSLKATLDSLHREQDMALVRTRDLTMERSKSEGYAAEIVALKKQIADMHSAAEDGKTARFEADKHKAVAEAWQGAMAMVFKPNAVRESVQRNHTVMVPTGSGSGYPQAVQNQDHILREDA